MDPGNPGNPGNTGAMFLLAKKLPVYLGNLLAATLADAIDHLGLAKASLVECHLKKQVTFRRMKFFHTFIDSACCIFCLNRPIT